MSEESQTYWVLCAGGSPNAMLLFSLPPPARLWTWMHGKRFPAAPPQPLVARIQPGEETAEPPVFKEVPQIMKIEFMEALKAAGVDNIDYYDVEVRSKDGSVNLRGYKAYNIIGIVSAADLSKTEFSPENPARLVDGSIRSLTVDPKKARGLLLFRLAESVDTIIIHNSVKREMEKHNFKGVKFIPPEDHIS